MTDAPFSERQAKYAAWRNRVMEDSVTAKIDLTKLEENEDDSPKLSSVWSTESLFAESRAVAAREQRRG